MSCLTPNPALLAKLGSIVVHAEEYVSEDASVYDKITIQDLLGQPDVKQWLDEMRSQAMIPVKRK